MGKKPTKKASKYKPSDLDGFMESTVSIECSVAGCKNSDGEWQTDEDGAAIEFFDRGWRATASNVYCPEHAKLKLKNI